MSRAESFAFVAGGTVQAGGGVYLERRADRELLDHCRAGDFTYILTSRQMGKSSLMIRTAERLAAEGALPVVIDLTEFGAQTTAEQWYKGFLSACRISSSCAAGGRTGGTRRPITPSRTGSRGTCARWRWWSAPSGSCVFVDEIDTTLRLDFTDDFFAAIRFLYQQRAAEPDLERLSFVLIGVATPGDLIKDAARTPFNIGHRIELSDFTLDEASALARPSRGARSAAARSDRVDSPLDRRASVSDTAGRPFARRVASGGVDGRRGGRTDRRAVPGARAARATATCSSSATC